MSPTHPNLNTAPVGAEAADGIGKTQHHVATQSGDALFLQVVVPGAAVYTDVAVEQVEGG